jgi:6-phosphogluconolactonase
LTLVAQKLIPAWAPAAGSPSRKDGRVTERTFVVVGSVTRDTPYFQGARGKGLTVFAFDEKSGELTRLSEKGGVDNPTYLTVHEGNRCVYANSEVFGWNEGTVSAYRLDPRSGSLSYINKQPALGSILAHNSLDRTGRFVFVANYSVYAEPDDGLPDQSVVVMPVRSDGGLGPAVSSRSHPGSGPNAARQERSHAHCVLASPDNRHVLVADLGIDQLVVYDFDAASGALSAAPAPFTMKAGSGPRHFAFHPSGSYVYAISELDSTITALAFDAALGALTHLQTVSALPSGYVEESHCAGLQLTPDGRHLYGSNRGHDSLVVYAVDESTGRLSLVEHHSCLGKTPRDFAIDPSGHFLLVANQNSDAVIVFRIDPQSGKLTDSGQHAEIATPMCVKFACFP